PLHHHPPLDTFDQRHQHRHPSLSKHHRENQTASPFPRNGKRPEIHHSPSLVRLRQPRPFRPRPLARRRHHLTGRRTGRRHHRRRAWLGHRPYRRFPRWVGRCGPHAHRRSHVRSTVHSPRHPLQNRPRAPAYRGHQPSHR